MEKNENTVVTAVEERKSNKKRTIIVVVAIILVICLLANLASASTGDEPKLLSEEATEEINYNITEAEDLGNGELLGVIEEDENSSTSTNTNKTTTTTNTKKKVYISPANIADDSETELKPETESKYEEIKTITVEISKKNPTVNTYSDKAFGQITVKAEGEDITSSCTVKIDSSRVGSVSGTYDVIISADCGNNGKAVRTASITLYIPTKEEVEATNKPSTVSETTTTAVTAPRVEITTNENGEAKVEMPASQELTKIILVKKDGTQVNFIKEEIENAYATQISKIMVEGETAKNVKIAADYSTIIIAGRVFRAV